MTNNPFICPWCGDSMRPDSIHRCQVLHDDPIVGYEANRTFDWKPWNLLILFALALAAVTGGIAGCVIDAVRGVE